MNIVIQQFTPFTMCERSSIAKQQQKINKDNCECVYL